LAYADDMNLLGHNIDTAKKSTESLIDASKEVGLEVNLEKTKYMSLSGHQSARKNDDVMIANTYFENMALGMAAVNQNLIWKEIKR
jgi:hypothetical protein